MYTNVTMLSHKSNTLFTNYLPFLFLSYFNHDLTVLNIIAIIKVIVI